jgi:hypothetical protein
LILAVLDLLLDDSIESCSAQKSMIRRWQGYLAEGIDPLVQAWLQKRKDPTVTQLLAWNLNDSKVTASLEDSKKSNFYSRITKMMSGWS